MFVNAVTWHGLLRMMPTALKEDLSFNCLPVATASVGLMKEWFTTVPRFWPFKPGSELEAAVRWGKSERVEVILAV